MKPIPKSQTFSNGHKVNQMQMRHLVPEKGYTDNPQQLTSAGTICRAKVPEKQPSSGRGHGEKFVTDNFVLRNGLHDDPEASGTSALPSGYLNTQHKSFHLSDRLSSKDITCSPHERQSLEKLFLDLKLVELTKEDEDSASDLSDSERLPIPLSPLTPPELNLRAEEISPGYFSHDVQAKGKAFDYPDILPLPYSTWNLSEVSTFLNKKGNNTLQEAPFLERYVERLLQLEWLQLQTVQAEKAKTNKSRPQTAHGLCRNGKSLGKSRSWHSPSPSKQHSSSDNFFKMTFAQERSSHRRDPNSQHSDLTSACQSPTKVYGSMNVPGSPFRQLQDKRVVTKKASIINSQQTKDFSSSSGSTSKINSTGNLRPPKQTSLSIYSPSTPKHAKSSKLKKTSCQPVSGSDTDYSLAKRNGNPGPSSFV